MTDKEWYYIMLLPTQICKNCSGCICEYCAVKHLVQMAFKRKAIPEKYREKLNVCKFCGVEE